MKAILLLAALLIPAWSIAGPIYQIKTVAVKQAQLVRDQLISGGMLPGSWYENIDTNKPSELQFRWKQPAGGPITITGIHDIAALRIEYRQRMAQSEDEGLTLQQQFAALRRAVKIYGILDARD